MKLINYIANQLFREGIDEIQALVLCQRFGIHAALEGPPGVGKTEVVQELAKVLGLKLYSKTCSTRTSESHIISYPALEKEGEATVTRHRNGPLAMAMEEGGIFYADEFNLLKEDTQKRLNSAIDDRRSIDRNDGVQIKAKKEFWTVISYNPSDGMNIHDLEESVADRFLHFYFKPWEPNFLAYVSHQKASRKFSNGTPEAKTFNIELSLRGIGDAGELFRGVNDSSGAVQWKEFFSGKKVAKDRVKYVYRVYDNYSIFRTKDPDELNLIKKMAAMGYKPEELSKVLSRLITTLKEMSETGSSPLLKKIGLGDIHKQEDAQLLSIHKSGVRAVSAALTLYTHLIDEGFNPYLAQSFASRLVINQMCYGQYRERKMTGMNSLELVETVAKGFGLFAGGTKFNTDF